jgi:hypothetical protein
MDFKSFNGMIAKDMPESVIINLSLAEIYLPDDDFMLFILIVQFSLFSEVNGTHNTSSPVSPAFA